MYVYICVDILLHMWMCVRAWRGCIYVNKGLCLREWLCVYLCVSVCVSVRECVCVRETDGDGGEWLEQSSILTFPCKTFVSQAQQTLSKPPIPIPRSTKKKVQHKRVHCPIYSKRGRLWMDEIWWLTDRERDLPRYFFFNFFFFSCATCCLLL